jgi:hypothetical protein
MPLGDSAESMGKFVWVKAASLARGGKDSLRTPEGAGGAAIEPACGDVPAFARVLSRGTLALGGRSKGLHSKTPAPADFTSASRAQRRRNFCSASSVAIDPHGTCIAKPDRHYARIELSAKELARYCSFTGMNNAPSMDPLLMIRMLIVLRVCHPVRRRLCAEVLVVAEAVRGRRPPPPAQGAKACSRSSADRKHSSARERTVGRRMAAIPP